MARRILLLLSCAVSLSVASAQESFTAKLQRRVANQGIVVLHHDAEIDALVNGGSRHAGQAAGSAGSNSSVSAGNASDPADISSSTASSSSLGGKKVRMNGYRIQVYVGGNSRDAKAKAEQMEAKVRSYYPELSTYTRFVSPRWICHVGDFKTQTEAVEFLTELRNKGGFDDAIVVKCKINAPAD
ncbi:MAG: SPOR domain-containing protein [Prevotellaceae bacterium]|nr:SPOR domain-containing protein [Prevotellaceae bacterium]